jgi:hypothetical protein
MLTVSGSSVITSARQVLRGSRASATTRFIRSRSEKIPTNLPLCHDRNCADIVFHHGAHGFQHSLAKVGLVCLLILDQVA